MQNDTIVAISTPSGRAGIGVIRISGGEALQIIQIITRNKVKVRTPKLCEILDEQNQTIDEAIVILYKGPKSYSGDD